MSTNRIILISFISVLLLFLVVTEGAYLNDAEAAQKSVVGVIYPKMRDPYRSIFNLIVSGVKSVSNVDVKTFTLEESTDPEKLKKWAQKYNIKTVIALGREGYLFSKTLPEDTKPILGAILVPPKSAEYIGGITVTPSPKQLFSTLKKLSPNSKHITAVYHEPTSGWLIAGAKESAKNLGFEFNALEANSLSEAAGIYKELLENVDETHAVWLLQDNKTVDQRNILPMLLKNAWSKSFVVFSSNPAHVKRGVLFSLYPDNKKMGSSLGLLASQMVAEGAVNKMTMHPLEDLLIAVNLRTADHLQLQLSRDERDSFDLTFPSSH